MPSWSYIGDATDWNINTPMTTTMMQQTEKTATIKAIAAPGVEVADYDNEIDFGNAINEAASQQAVAIAPVLISDRLYDTANQEPVIILEKKDSISYIPKETPFAEAERIANLRRTKLYCSQFYAIKLTKDDGICFAKATI